MTVSLCFEFRVEEMGLDVEWKKRVGMWKKGFGADSTELLFCHFREVESPSEVLYLAVDTHKWKILYL